MKQSLALPLSFTLILPACVSRAPTKCELDQRAGIYPSSHCVPDGGPSLTSFEADLKRLQEKQMAAKEPGVPLRLEPVVTRVWIHDQVLDGGHWMQGTWVFLEVEPSRWLRAPDVPGKPVARPVQISSQKKEKGTIASASAKTKKGN